MGRELKWTYEKIKEFIEGKGGNGCQLLTKENEYINIKHKIKILCGCGENEFEVNFSKFVSRNKRQCNNCGFQNQLRKQRNDYYYIKLFIEGKEGNGCKLISDENEYLNSKSKLLINCKCGEKFKSDWSTFKGRNKRQCNKCGIKKCSDFKRISYEEVKENVKLKNIKLLTTKEEYKDAQTKIKGILPEGYIIEFTYTNFIQKQNIPPIVNWSNSFSIYNIDLWTKINNKPFCLLSTNYNKGKDKLLWKCLNNSEHIFDTSWNEIRNNHGCPYCVGKRVDKTNSLESLLPYIAKEWNYDKNKSLPSEVTIGSRKKVWWKCIECGYEYIMMINKRTLRNHGCIKCNHSHGEKLIKIFLEKYCFYFINEYSFLDLIGLGGGLLRFDFAVFEDKEKTKLKYLIEFDGEQHFRWVKGWITKENFEKLKCHDKLKNEYCKNKNIKLLRIKYDQSDSTEQLLSDFLFYNKERMIDNVANI